MADSRNLADLHPKVRVMAVRLLEEAKSAGIPLTVTFTTRSMETQGALYAQGRTAPGRVVTNAEPGYSYHNFGLAIDVVPTELLALPRWGDTPAHQAHANRLWDQVGAIGKATGFRWGGDFVHFKDRPHFEWSGGLTLAELRTGARPAVHDGSPHDIIETRESMKIKLVRLAGKIVVAAPVMLAAIKPVADAFKKPDQTDKSTGHPRPIKFIPDRLC